VIFDSHMHVGSFESMFRVSLDRDGMVDLMRENEIENGVVFHPDNAYVAQVVESIPGLTWPSITFAQRMSVWLGQREVRIMHLGRAHTAGDVVAWVPDARVVFSGDLVEYRSACYCGDAHFTDWPATLDRLSALGAQAMVPGRGAALGTPAKTAEGIAMTRDFLGTLYGAVGRSVAAGHSLKQAFSAARTVMDPKFSSFAIYEHCLPFNVARAFDEAKGIDHPVIWTAERDREMWAALQG